MPIIETKHENVTNRNLIVLFILGIAILTIINTTTNIFVIIIATLVLTLILSFFVNFPSHGIQSHDMIFTDNVLDIDSIKIPSGFNFDKLVFKLDNLDTTSVMERTKDVLQDFGFDKFKEAVSKMPNGMDILIQSQSNEFAGSTIQLSMLFQQVDPRVVKCHLLLASPDITILHVLMEQLKQVLGPARCPVCKEIITISQELDFELDKDTICKSCNTVLTKIERVKL